ncbi:helix-turn-helix domain-containing protein [Ferruginibacter albus]|uniref:helix-turn-helix domain-containing protein n=1 Tax=Ferruginibacter albus TaxID=2875540 RepID=UPI001CC63698|nr:helix-turn-helix domain-containing protein [Ferruginibacter albus]UAY52009.1 helix-turn-helix domain-containing protein [Ferruginibacter albus]
MSLSFIVEHNEVFDLAFRFVTETSENIFLTGKAGTGKTTFLKYLKDNCAKNIVVAAPTGVAAINAGGVTLHSLFQLPFHPFLPTANNKSELLSKLRFTGQRQQLLRKMELLVIDEISMVRADTLDAIDTILRSVRRNHDLAFGGVQLLCIGDLFQLPPVAQQHEWMILQEYYSSPFFFDSLAIKEQMPLLIELNKIYRQKEESFVRLLNKVRTNNMDADDFEDLHLRYNPTFTPTEEEKYITLTSHNKQADAINEQQLNRIIAPAKTYKADIEGDFAENNFPAEAALVLKVGAQVMFLKNDAVQKRYFNGKIGVVKNLEDERIIVECDGFDIDVRKETWENSRYVLNREDGKLEQETLGMFTQYPLRLAWAITIHKSQGLTFEKVMIDAGASFSSGQVYVALSRCTSLDGIVLLSKLNAATLFNNDNVLKAQQSLAHKGSLAERFEGARKLFTQQLMQEIFSFTNILLALNSLEYHIKEQHLKLSDGSIEWIGNLKQNVISDKSVGEKFILLVNELLKEEGVIEKNPLLQKRINDAANHFIPRSTQYLSSVKNTILSTEHKETSAVINEQLQNTAITIYTSLYFLEYCKNAFSIRDFLHYKLKFVTPKFSINSYAGAKKETVTITDTANMALYDKLRIWRDNILKETGQPIYMVANKASLMEICQYLPLTKKELQQIGGFGRAKVEKYGDEILDTVQQYCTENNLVSLINLKEPVTKKSTKTKATTEEKIDTKTLTLNLYKQGKTISEIAKDRSFTISTIEGHLAHFIQTGEINIDNLVSIEKQIEIKAAIEKAGSENYKALFSELKGIMSYGEIRMVAASMNISQQATS